MEAASGNRGSSQPGWRIYSALVAFIGVVVLLTALLVFRPFGSVGKNVNYDRARLSCSMEMEGVNFSVSFTIWDMGVQYLFVDDLEFGQYTEHQPVSCETVDASCLVSGFATEQENHRDRGYSYFVTMNHDGSFELIVENTQLQLLVTHTSQKGKMFLIRSSPPEGGLFVYQFDADLEDAYNSTIDAWDPCGYAYQNENVIQFIKKISENSY